MTAFALRSGAEPRAGGDVSTPEDAVAAEQRFLEELRRRVAWPAEAAARLRAEQAVASPPDVLDLDALAALLASTPDAPRAAEWRLFLDELRFLAEPSGRLPAALERLVRVVLADLLER